MKLRSSAACSDGGSCVDAVVSDTSSGVVLDVSSETGHSSTLLDSFWVSRSLLGESLPCELW